MHPKFVAIMDPIHEQYEKLLNCRPITPGDAINHLPQSGVYLFTENGVHLYVGRTNRMQLRYIEHRRSSSSFDHAALANRITRSELGVARTNRRDAKYFKAFKKNIERVAKMDFRYVEEADDHRQFLLEFYCVAVLETSHNHFRTH